MFWEASKLTNLNGPEPTGLSCCCATVPSGMIGIGVRFDSNWCFNDGRATVITMVLGSGVVIDSMCGTVLVFGSSAGLAAAFVFAGVTAMFADGFACGLSVFETGTVSKNAPDLKPLLLKSSSREYFTSAEVTSLPL